MIRTVFAGALALAFAVAFAGCGGDSPTTPAPAPAPAPPPAPAPEPDPEPAPAPRGVPAGLAVSATGPGFIEWSWSPLEGAEGYQVQYSPDAFFTADDEVVDRTAEETSYRRENLPAGTSAHLRVRASTGAAEERLFGDWSASVSGRSPIPVPSGLAVSATGGDFIEWSWDAVEGAAGYQVQYSLDTFFTADDELVDRTGEQTSYRRENLPAGTSAHLRVRASTGAGDERLFGDWSASVPASTPAPPLGTAPPATVTGIEAEEVGSDFVLWTWDPVPRAVRYQARVFPDAGYDSYVEDDLPEPMLRVDGLEPGSAVKITVRVVVRTEEGGVAWPWSDYVVAETLPPPPRQCTDERTLAVRQSEFVLEWDGTPLRVDMIDNFPDYVTEDAVAALLGAVGLLADKIEDQLGYRIVEMGEVVPVPEGVPPNWNKDPRDYRRNCWLPRDKGQIYGFYLDGVYGSAGAQAHPRCGAFTYLRRGVERRLDTATGEWPCTEPKCSPDKSTMHELFHVLGYRHIDDDPNEGVSMSRALDDATGAPGAQAVTWSDIDALRCIFPE